MITAQANMDPRARRPARDWLLAVVGLGIVLLLVWFLWLRPPDIEAGPAGGARSQVWYVTTYGSDAATIDRILSLQACASLSAAFVEGSDAFREEDTTRTERRGSVGVMAAAADRMNELGCPLN